MEKEIHQYRKSERGSVDIALILSFVVFLFSLSAAFFYFSFDKNSRISGPSDTAQMQTPQQEEVIPIVQPVSVQEGEEVVAISSPVKESSVTVFIGSYSKIKKEYLEGIQTAVKKATGAQVTVLGGASALAKKAPLYDAVRQQYDADVLLKGVETASLEYGAKSRFIYVFDIDMYSSSNPSLKSVWFAGTKGKNVSIVSLYSLQKKSDMDTASAISSLVVSRLQKNALHMIGMNIGISPSFDTKCIMYPAKTLTEIDRQGTEYCASEQVLINEAFAQ